jgi:hypothetical protein
MENMDKELKVPKWVLIVRPAQAQKFKDFWKKLSLGVRSPSLLSKRRWENIAEYVYRINARFIM